MKYDEIEIWYERKCDKVKIIGMRRERILICKEEPSVEELLDYAKQNIYQNDGTGVYETVAFIKVNDEVIYEEAEA